MIRTLEPPSARYFAHEIQVDGESALALGVEVAPSPDGGAPLRHEGREAIVVSWDDLRELALVDPWPRFRLAWSFPGGSTSELVGPERPEDELAFAEAVERAVAHVETRRPDRVARGWLDAPVVSWEPVASMPVDERALDMVDWLRASPAQLQERVRASRERTSYEALFGWLTSRPSLPWREQPKALSVTDEHVYAQRTAGTVHRLPLCALRLAFHNDSEDQVFVFGRCTRLVLPARLQCRVVDELLDRLEEAEDEAEDAAAGEDAEPGSR